MSFLHYPIDMQFDSKDNFLLMANNMDKDMDT